MRFLIAELNDHRAHEFRQDDQYVRGVKRFVEDTAHTGLKVSSRVRCVLFVDVDRHPELERLFPASFSNTLFVKCLLGDNIKSS